MIGLLLEIGIRTSVWAIMKGCKGIYYICYGRKQQIAKEERLELRIKDLETKIESLSQKL